MFSRYRAVICGSTLVMIGLSWPLWIDGPDFPRVPFFRGWPEFPTALSWLMLSGILGAVGLAMVGFRWRLMLRVGLPLLVVAILEDQNRFQPWAYQFAWIGLVMAWLPRARALAMARWYVFALYLYSGLSKLDGSFCREMGPAFLTAGLGPLGIHSERWPEKAQSLACLTMPAFEIATAWLLINPGTRRVGVVAAVVQHSALLGILGPWGLGHSGIVLVWNLALIVQDVVLFGRSTIPADSEIESMFGRLIRGAFWVALILPSGERLGFCDAWPGHALYASHVERSEIFLHEDDLDRFPEAIRRRVGPAGVTPWRRLDLTGWSRDLRGTPLYPSGRIGNALAEFLELRYAGEQPVRLVQWGRAHGWTGVRERDESLGIRAIRSRGSRFLLNARPARSEHP